MGFFAQQIKTVILDDENSVTICKPSFGQRQTLLSSVAKGNATTQEVTIDVGKQRQEILCLWVTGWSGPGFEGRPVSRENVLALPLEIADKILEAIDEFNTPLSEDVKN